MPNIPKLIAKNLKKYGKSLGVKACTLTRVTPGSSRTTGAEASGTNPTSVSYPASGWIEEYDTTYMPGTLIQNGDRKISVLGGTLPAGIAPKPNDKIAIVDLDGVSRTFRIIAVPSDPVGAVFICQARA